jgi:endonuclease/exonuclease/phosphatase family metal-dependent hydrolase
MLRIATYNIWNAKTQWPRRLAAIAEELVRLDADIVALQEAPVRASVGLPLAAYLRERTGYPHLLYLPYPGPADKREWPEGLAFLSKLPLTRMRANWAGGEPTENSWAARVEVRWQARRLGITNVHLDWRHAESRERHIVKIVRDLIDARAADAGPGDLDVLCGDFNDDGDAPVLRFLAGTLPLDGYETAWHDLAAEWHAAQDRPAPVTLDFEHNPRWQGKTVRDHSKRFDRIYLRAAAAGEQPPILAAGLFGHEPTNSFGVIPSDHYGLYVDLDL